jgi:LCP family protein required for cell wall assembly
MNLNLFNRLKRNISLKKRNSKKKKKNSKYYSGSKGRGIFSEFSKYKNGFVLLLLFGLALFIVGWLIYCLLQVAILDLEPAYKDEKIESVYEWRGDGRINIMFVGLDKREGEFGYVDALLVAVIDPQSQSIGIFDVNVDTAVFLPHIERHEKIRNLYSWGVIEDTVVPVDLLCEKVENLLSLKLNRYFIMDERSLIDLVDNLHGVTVYNPTELTGQNTDSDLVLDKGTFRLNGEDFLDFVSTGEHSNDEKLQRQINAFEGLIKRISSYLLLIKVPSITAIFENDVRTNITKNELMRLAYTMAQIQEVNSSYMGNGTLIEQHYVYGIYRIPLYEKLDEDIQGVFVDTQIGKEQARVEIFNSTDISGLASFRARWLKNIGIDVIRVGDTAEIYGKTTIYCKEEGIYDHTLEAIRKTFDEEIDILYETPDIISTGDIVIIIGENVKEVSY